MTGEPELQRALEILRSIVLSAELTSSMRFAIAAAILGLEQALTKEMPAYDRAWGEP